MSALPLRLWVGLGNPGHEYALTRHNVGFWWLDKLAEQKHLSFTYKAKFHGDIASWPEQNWLLKPTTYMNKSGIAVHSLAHFYQVPPQQILVIHDDLDLPVGTVRLKKSGGHGGHNGLRNIIQQLGSQDFMRLRIGIGHPGEKTQVYNYVLHSPSLSERDAIDQGIEESFKVLDLLHSGAIDKAVQLLHTKKG